jgi:hypothetical protein
MMSTHPAIPQSVLDLWVKLNASDQDRFFAFMLRLRNGDAKAIRLGDLHASGKISLRQLLDAVRPAKGSRP